LIEHEWQTDKWHAGQLGSLSAVYPQTVQVFDLALDNSSFIFREISFSIEHETGDSKIKS